YFLTIADEQNISRAADLIHITQPTLSRQIMDLELELGVQLFERNKQNRKFLLTEEGTRFYNYAQEIVQLSEKTLEDFKSRDSEIFGKIYIGAGETSAISTVARAFFSLKQKHPRLEISLFSSDASVISERMDKGLCDFGIFIGFKNAEKYEQLLLPQKNMWGLLTHKDNPLAKYNSIKRENLLEHYEPLMISQQALTKKELLDWFGGSMEKYNVMGTYNLLYNASIFVKGKVCSAITLNGLTDTSQNSDLRFIPLEPVVESEVVLAWKKDVKLSKQAKLLLEEIKK
ncbi:MAG: LysR family transcriptional regulator, partial [Treponema sp.]|nr:LysR family transcriptional regulator [Candidatus Treponema equifaecale]